MLLTVLSRFLDDNSVTRPSPLQPLSLLVNTAPVHEYNSIEFSYFSDELHSTLRVCGYLSLLRSLALHPVGIDESYFMFHSLVAHYAQR
jgi:hypothetical protein